MHRNASTGQAGGQAYRAEAAEVCLSQKDIYANKNSPIEDHSFVVGGRLSDMRIMMQTIERRRGWLGLPPPAMPVQYCSTGDYIVLDYTLNMNMAIIPRAALLP